MKGYYKLIDSIKQPQTVAVARKANGMIRHGHAKMMPGQKYDLEEGRGDGKVDPVLLESLRKYKVLKRKTADLVKTLEEAGVEYEEIACKSCGGRVMKLSYRIVEVVITEE